MLNLKSKDKLSLFGICMICLVVLGVVICYFLYKPEQRDNCSCPISGAKEHCILILDSTSELSPNAQRTIKNNIEKIVNNATVDTLFSLYTIDSEEMGGLSGPKFMQCKIGDGSDVKYGLIENSDMLEKDFKKVFHTPLMGAVGKILSSPEQEFSPILEAIKDIENVKLRQHSLPTTVYIFSDMLQNSQAYNQYQINENFASAVQSLKPYSLVPDLNEVKVELFYIRRSGKILALQNENHIQFWRDYLNEAKVKDINVTYIR